jgi:pimeloyl-ACP methyl ester carboxylesterase
MNLPVLLVHGIQSGPSTWWRVAPDLETLGFDVLLATLPGHLGSPAAPTLTALALAVAPQEPAFVVGHSLGALVALELAAIRPDLVLGLLLEDPPSRSAVDPADLAAEIRADADEAQRDPEGLQARLLEANPLWNVQDAAHAVANRAAVDVAGAAAPLEHADWDVAAMAAAVTCPVMVLAATPAASALGEPERSLLLAAASRSVLVESGHGIHRDRPGVWVAVVAEAAGGASHPGTGRPGP